MVHEIYERSFARFRALASDTSIIGDCDAQIEESKEESKVNALGKCSGLFKRTKVSPNPNPNPDPNPTPIPNPNPNPNPDPNDYPSPNPNPSPSPDANLNPGPNQTL